MTTSNDNVDPLCKMRKKWALFCSAAVDDASGDKIYPKWCVNFRRYRTGG